MRVKSEGHACATMPLLAGDGTLLGVVNFGFDEPHRFSEEEAELIGLVARRWAEAMAAARSLEHDVHRRGVASPRP